MHLVHGADRLTRVFGEWPSFHDAEVLRLELHRAGPRGPFLDAAIHHWTLTDEVDSKGFLVTKLHTLTTFRFHDVDRVELSGFNRQNVLSNLVIEAMEPESDHGHQIRVHLESCFGVDARFVCRSCEIISTAPHESTDPG